MIYHLGANQYNLTVSMKLSRGLGRSKLVKMDRNSSQQCLHKLTMGLKTYQEIKQAHLGTAKHTIDVLTKLYEHKECTFEPKIHNSSGKMRSLGEFLKDQDKFLASKEEKIQLLRKEIGKAEEDELTGRPTIDKNSQHISQNMSSSIRSTNIFKRLSQQKQSAVTNNDEHLFTPKILNKSKSIVRSSNISTTLYEDARRRQEKEVFIQEESNKKVNVSPKINSNTNILVGKKVCSQFNQLVPEEEVNPLVGLSVLSEIFNIDLNPNKNAKSAEQCNKILRHLQLPQETTIRSERLWTFIQTLINGRLPKTCFDRNEQAEIIANYQHFYQERLTRDRKTLSPKQPSFRPKTLPNSQKMADHHREKMCEAVNEFMDTQKINLNLKEGSMKIQDLLIIDHIQRKVSNQKRKTAKETKQLEQCSFKPDVSSSSLTLESLRKKKKIVLVAHSKGNSGKIESELSIQRAPLQVRKRNASNRSGAKREDSLKEVKNIEKVVLRMSIGRQNREYEAKVLERGYAKDENYVQFKNEKHREVIESSRQFKGYTMRH